jgi:hypothetical protein
VKLEIKDSANYAAVVVRVPEPFKLPNSDRLYGVGIFGYTVVVDTSWVAREGELAVFFPAEAQLAEWFTSEANLFRHNERNKDQTESGYLEDNRRVRALKLRGTVSNGLLLPISVLGKAGFAEGDTFDTIDGVEYCRKYRIKEPQPPRSREDRKLSKAFKRVDAKLFPVHVETDVAGLVGPQGPPRTRTGGVLRPAGWFTPGHQGSEERDAEPLLRLRPVDEEAGGGRRQDPRERRRLW